MERINPIVQCDFSVTGLLAAITTLLTKGNDKMRLRVCSKDYHYAIELLEGYPLSFMVIEDKAMKDDEWSLEYKDFIYVNPAS